MSGTLRVGTSGFAYPAWAPAFYPAGLRGEDLLRSYAERLTACELNNTFYRQPTESAVRGWLATDARVVPVRRQGPAGREHAGAPRRRPARERGLADPPARPVRGAARQRPLPGPGRGRPDRGAPRPARPAPRPVAGAVPAHDGVPARDVARRRDVRAAPGARRRALRAPTSTRWTSRRSSGSPGPFLYLRLRRTAYSDEDLDAWAARVAPFLDAGLDAYAFFRHDETGISPGRAMALAARLGPARVMTMARPASTPPGRRRRGSRGAR